MTRYVAFLRGINLGTAKRVKMADLRRALGAAGFDDPRTLLQSGNVILDSNADRDALTAIVETTIESGWGFTSTAILRTAGEILGLVADNPFSDEHLEDPRFAHVGFCREAPDQGGFDNLRELHEGPEELFLRAREIFVYYPDGSGRSKINNSLLERHLVTPVTSRNWNTVMKIADQLQDED